MKLITLWEPWATLMAIGAKKIETRDWSSGYRGWLAIHSAKGGLSKGSLIHQCCEAPFLDAMRGTVPASTKDGFIFPFGCIVAVCKLAYCVRTAALTAASPHLISHSREPLLPGLRHGSILTKEEYAFGNYGDGRYGLITTHVFKLPEPIPFKSRQGKLLDVPPSTVSAIQTQWCEVCDEA